MKILFICTANVCRSPLAEGYLTSILKLKTLEDRYLNVSSAGVMALEGTPAFECAISVARQHGFDLSQHRSRRLTLEIAREVDKILCMETWQANKIIDLSPALIEKVQLLGAFHPSNQRLLQINDPREFTAQETIKTFDVIRASVDSLLQRL